MDFYKTLGVPSNASQAEVKAAYQRLAKSLHPDVNPFGAALMQQVNEAYETLGDPTKRAAYDRTGKVRTFPNAASAPTATPGTIDLTYLAQAFIPAGIYATAGPSLIRLLEDRGIVPQAASVEQILEAAGILKKKKAAKRA